MQFSGVDVPEPFASALEKGFARAVIDQSVSTPREQFGRALCRCSIRLDEAARDDFEACRPQLGDACEVELAYLGIRRRGELDAALKSATAIAKRAANPSLAARAWHIAGLAHEKCGRPDAAIESLLTALDCYRRIGDRYGRAHVRDTLGSAELDRGALERAAQHYALSIVDKALLGDRMGMAITLGSLGRLHLRMGAYADAIDCFESDLAISRELDDRHGVVLMLHFLGTASLADGRLDQAESFLHESIRRAREQRFAEQEFYFHRMLGLVRIQQNRLDEARVELLAAKEAIPKGAPDALVALDWDAAWGNYLAACGDPQAVPVLQRVVQLAAESRLPDEEISARIDLAKALMQQRLKYAAEACLLEGMKRARAEGFQRYLVPLDEMMTQLGLVEGALDEKDREITSEPSSGHASGYILRQKVGAGSIGEVYRAYDPQHNREVAIKRFPLDRLYNPRRREWLVRQARTELEVASRIRNPGIVRIHAIGTDATGGMYVTQEFIGGGNLRQLYPRDASASFRTVLPLLLKVAESLEELHRAQIVHRDLKPENILLRGPEQPVLVDFGISWIAGESRQTPDGVVGTVEYMAPEQAAGKRVDGRADLYSLGVLAYEWLAGFRPVQLRGASFAELARDLQRREPAPLKEFRSDLPAEFESLLGRLLAKKPARRPSSAQEVVSVIAGALQ